MHRFKMFRKATSFAKYGQPAHKELSNCNDKYWPYSYPYTLHQLSNYHRFHNKYKQICSIYIYVYIMYIYYYCHTYIYVYIMYIYYYCHTYIYVYIMYIYYYCHIYIYVYIMYIYYYCHTYIYIYVYIMYIYYYCHTYIYVYNVYLLLLSYIYIYIYVYNVYLLLLSYIYIYICIYHVFMVNSSSLTQIFFGHVHQRVAQESRDEALSIEGLEPGEAVSIHWSGRTSKMLGLWGKIWKNPIKMI